MPSMLMPGGRLTNSDSTAQGVQKQLRLTLFQEQRDRIPNPSDPMVTRLIRGFPDTQFKSS